MLTPTHAYAETERVRDEKEQHLRLTAVLTSLLNFSTKDTITSEPYLPTSKRLSPPPPPMLSEAWETSENCRARNRPALGLRGPSRNCDQAIQILCFTARKDDA